MQDNFNSAQTPVDPQIANPHGAGQPRRPQPGQAPPVYDPNAQPGPADQTQTYHGPAPAAPDSRTLPDASPWPGRPDAASPFAPTVQRAPTKPRPQQRQPRQQQALAPIARPAAPPSAPPRISHPRSAPVQPARRSRWAAWIPLPHTLLIAGVALLLLATRLPWGVDSSGNLITLQTETIPAVNGAGDSGSALQVAYNLIGAVGVLSVGLLFFNILLSGLNRLLGRGCLAGCVVMPLYPILVALIGFLLVAQVLAAGFGGLGGLAITQHYGMGGAGVAHYEPGYYVWYTGLILNVAGMLGEFAVWRR